MVIYRWFWLACWMPIGVVSGGVGLLLEPLASVVTTTVFYGLLGGLVATALRSCGRAPFHPRSEDARAYVLRVAGWAALSGGLLQVWTAALGPTTWPVVALAVLTCPRVIARGLSWSPSPGFGRVSVQAAAPCGCGCGEAVSPGELAGVLTVLDDRQLCRAWRASASRLRTAPDATARLQVAMVRHAYLEEFERRDAIGLRCWLASEPLPTSGPEEYWRPGPEQLPEDQPGAA